MAITARGWIYQFMNYFRDPLDVRSFGFFCFFKGERAEEVWGEIAISPDPRPIRATAVEELQYVYHAR